MASTSSNSSLPPLLPLAQAGGRPGAPRQGVERVTFDVPPFTPPADRPTEVPVSARPAAAPPDTPAAADPVAPAPVSAPIPAPVVADEDAPPLIDVRLAEPEPTPAAPPSPPPAEPAPQVHAAPAEPVPAPVVEAAPAEAHTAPVLADAPHAAAPHADAEPVAYIAHPAAHEAHAHDEHGAAGPIDVSVEMFLWTLGTFLLMAWLLTKLAWRPILGALDKREEELRQAVDNAEQVRVELETIEEKRSHIILDADTKAKEIVDRARVAGREAGRVITEKAKQEAAIIQENTQRELNTAREKAAADLRQESVDRAIELAEKILEQKLSAAQQKKLTDRLIEQI